MRHVIAVLAVAGVVVSCLALAEHYGAPAKPISLLHSVWNSAYVNKAPLPQFMGFPVALFGVTGYVHYTGNWKGSMEGWLLTPTTGYQQLPNTLPGLRQFLMVGQWIMPGGGRCRQAY